MPELYLSAEGLATLEKDEGNIPGLYDDPSDYCTFGVGHLVHKTSKWPCFTLAAASADTRWAKTTDKMWPGKKYETPYLRTGVKFEKDFDALKGAALEKAKAHIAEKKYKKAFAALDAKQKAEVEGAAGVAIDAESGLLGRTSGEVLREDVKPFEAAVRKATAGLDVNQGEFDALVSFAFNVGTGNFNGSTLLKKIKEGKTLKGDAASRKAAIDAIEGEFLKWNKSGGKVLTGLTRRRKEEATRFLKRARDELAKLKESGPAPKTPASPPRVDPLEDPRPRLLGAIVPPLK